MTIVTAVLRLEMGQSKSVSIAGKEVMFMVVGFIVELR
jgi:hypothetical protein